MEIWLQPRRESFCSLNFDFWDFEIHVPAIYLPYSSTQRLDRRYILLWWQKPEVTETRGSYRAGIVVTTEENTESDITHARSTVYNPGWRHQMKHFPRYWPFVRGIHRSPVNSPHKGQWRGALRFCLICAWINGWVNNREAGDLRRQRAHYDGIIMSTYWCETWLSLA